MKQFFVVWLAALLLGTILFARTNVQAQETTFSTGDVFAAIGEGKVNWYSPQGNLIKTLRTGADGLNAGMAFDKNSALYVTNFSASSISKFDAHGNLVGAFGAEFGDNPESIVFDEQGFVYVGHAGTEIFFADVKLRKFDATGKLLTTYDLQTDRRGTDWIDLAADQCTLFYTSEGESVLRYDVCTQRQLPTLTTALHGEAYALRILDDGGVLVSDSVDIHRLDAQGNITQTYDAPNEDSWFALNRDPDGISFWSGDIVRGNIYKFDIASGNVLLGPIHACDTEACLGGLAVYGELTEAIAPSEAMAPSMVPWYAWMVPLCLLPIIPMALWLWNKKPHKRKTTAPTRRDYIPPTSGRLPDKSSRSGADAHHGRDEPKK